MTAIERHRLALDDLALKMGELSESNRRLTGMRRRAHMFGFDEIAKAEAERNSLAAAVRELQNATTSTKNLASAERREINLRHSRTLADHFVVVAHERLTGAEFAAIKEEAAVRAATPDAHSTEGRDG